jgi:hypothetical protein
MAGVSKMIHSRSLRRMYARRIRFGHRRGQGHPVLKGTLDGGDESCEEKDEQKRSSRGGRIRAR